MLIFRKKPKKNLQAAKAKTDKMQGSMATTTKLVKGIFDDVFKDQLDEDESKESGGRRRRCGACEVSALRSMILKKYGYHTEGIRSDIFTKIINVFLVVLSGSRVWRMQKLQRYG